MPAALASRCRVSSRAVTDLRPHHVGLTTSGLSKMGYETELQFTGVIIEISREGDGEIWGWEFDPRRRYRELGLVPIGKWRSSNTGLSRRRTVRRSASK